MPRNNLTKNLTFRLSETDSQALTLLARRFGTKRSRMLRKVICESVGLGPYLLNGDLDLFREALRNVRAIGVNLNQLTRAVNAGKVSWSSPDDERIVQDILKMVQELRQEMGAIIARSCDRPVKDAA